MNRKDFPCLVEGCPRVVHARGWCQAHYKLWQAHGTPTPVRKTVEQRFREKYVVSESGCWIWTACLDREGYGQFGVGRGHRAAHRVSFELHRGPIPEGHELDHLCRTPACVNPAHLDPVTHTENVHRGESWSGKNIRKTHCPGGHPYDRENTYLNKHGHRGCRACARIRANRRYHQSRRVS
ncbi:HNH endonuclease signature motif containing protein [Nocardia nova]